MLKNKKAIYNQVKFDELSNLKVLLDIVNDSEFSMLLKQSAQKEFNNQSDKLLAKFLLQNGFMALPTKVNENEYNLLVKSNLTQIYRGVKIADAQNDYNNNLNMFVGHGLYLNGIYFSYGSHGLKDAKKYAILSNKYSITNKDFTNMELNNGSIIKALVKSDAKVVNLGDLVKINSQIIKQAAKTKELSHNTKCKIINMLSSDMAKTAALIGFDMVKIPELKYMVVLNRGKTIVQENNELKK